nr:hypothetical protein [Leptospira abararensis]
MLSLNIKTFPKKILEVAYPTHIVADKVHESGFAQYYGAHRLFFGNPFIGEVVGFEEISDRYAKIHFYDVSLGVIEVYTGKLLHFKN